MYRYYQTREKGAWHPLLLKSGQDPEGLALEKGARKLTILATNELVADGDDEGISRNRDQISYKGPLYFDIDCKEDLGQAIESGIRLCDRLISLGVPEELLQPFASGSKGVHLLVPDSLFSSGRFTRRLPEIYREMARELFVPGLDFAVYSAGRGNSFRIQNVQREDGNYRVPLTYAELKLLTADSYRQLVKQPKQLHRMDAPNLKVQDLEIMFEEAKKRVNAKQKVVLIASSVEMEAIKAEPPACIHALVDYKTLRAGVTFNQVATQVATYAVRANPTSHITEGLFDRLAQHGVSSSYNSVRDRRQHLQGQVGYLRHNLGFHFGCNAIRALLAKSPCEGCPLEKSESHGRGADGDIGCLVREDGYYVKQAEGSRRLTNFVLTPTDTFIDVPQDGTSPRRVGSMMQVIKDGLTLASIVTDESAFTSRSAFLRSVEGLHDLVFQGSDNDVQRIKKVVFESSGDLGEVYRVYAAGMHVNEVHGKPVMTYVEPGMSINSMKVRDTHQFAGEMQARPHFAEAKLAQPANPDTESAVLALLRINQPTEVALIIGWFVATHFKAHIDYLYSEFPVLSLWGNAGSGKSKTAELVSWLCGTDYMRSDSGVNVTDITPFALLDYISNTSTVPRLLEEYNKSKMQRGSKFQQVGEMLKAAWGGESILKGTIGKGGGARGRSGATTVSYKVCAPLVVMSEQELEMPAIQERTIRVKLSKNKRAGRKGFFAEAQEGRELLRSVGKVLMFTALTTPPEEVRKQMEVASGLLPDDLTDRPRRSLQVVLFALRAFRRVLAEQLQYRTASEVVEELEGELVKYAMKLAGEAVVQSEVDLVVSEIMVLITMSVAAQSSGTGVVWLRPMVDYMITDSYLLIDPVLAHTFYVHYMTKEKRKPPVIDEVNQFLNLITEEPYFSAMDRYQQLGDGRPVLFLDLSKMREKGLNVGLICPEEPENAAAADA